MKLLALVLTIGCLVGYAMISVGWLVASFIIFPLIPAYPLVVLAKYGVFPPIGWLGLAWFGISLIAFRNDDVPSY